MQSMNTMSVYTTNNTKNESKRLFDFNNTTDACVYVHTRK
ncbi:hypothetical protein DOY81_001355 [Sarcophaga bullata]|nr:hypothetical protein DOY81_001355 [Sarcophaga bullata]